MILLVTFVDWAKKMFCDARRTNRWTDRHVGQNSDVDMMITASKIQKGNFPRISTSEFEFPAKTMFANNSKIVD